MDDKKPQLSTSDNEDTSVEEKIKKARKDRRTLIKIDKLDKDIASLKKQLAMKKTQKSELAKEL